MISFHIMVMFSLLLMVLYLKTMKDVINDKETKLFFKFYLSDLRFKRFCIIKTEFTQE